MFVNTRGYPSSTATLTSPVVKVDGNKTINCLTFAYHMHGASVDMLNVYIRSGSGNKRTVWSRLGTQGDRWILAEVQLNIIQQSYVSGQYLSLLIESPTNKE